MHKKSKKLSIRIFVLLMCAILVGNTGFALAATDVTQTHWASTQIENVTSKNIMPLYVDNTFRPNTVVTSLEVVVSIYRTIKQAGLITTTQMNTIVAKHEVSLKALGIPQTLAPYGSETYLALAYALEKNILTLDEIKVFVSGTTLTNVKKVNAVVLVAKALNVYKQENLNKIILLSYKDSAEISLSAIKYVNLAIEQGIISSKGDSLGNFNPSTSINRATLAILISGLSKVVSSGITIPEPTTEPTTEASTEAATSEPVGIETEKIFTGTVKAVNDATFSITVTNASGKTETFSLVDATVTAAGVKTSFNSITLNAQIELTIEDGLVTVAALEKSLSKVEGNFVLLSGYIGDSTTRKSMKIVLPSKANDFKNVYNDTLVTINGVPAKATDIKVGYKVIVLYEGFDAKRIIAFSELYEFYGIMNTAVDIKAPGKFEITQESGNIVSGTLTSTVSFVNAAAGYKAGDIVKVTMKLGVVTRLEYIGQAKTIVGKISGIHIMKTPELTVTIVTGKDETHALSTKVKILNETGENALTIYDLRLDQEVTVDIGIGGIKEIQLGRKIIAEPTGVKVTVTQVVDTSNIILAIDESNRVRTITFPVGSTDKASNYKAGMVLFVEGKAIADTIFEVIKITVQTQ